MSEMTFIGYTLAVLPDDELARLQDVLNGVAAESGQVAKIDLDYDLQLKTKLTGKTFFSGVSFVDKNSGYVMRDMTPQHAVMLAWDRGFRYGSGGAGQCWVGVSVARDPQDPLIKVCQLPIAGDGRALRDQVEAASGTALVPGQIWMRAPDKSERACQSHLFYEAMWLNHSVTECLVEDTLALRIRDDENATLRLSGLKDVMREGRVLIDTLSEQDGVVTFAGHKGRILYLTHVLSSLAPGQRNYELLAPIESHKSKEVFRRAHLSLDDYAAVPVELSESPVPEGGQSHFKLVVMRDADRDWSSDLLKRAGGAIYSTYLVDVQSATNCAELTPSCYFRHLFSTPLAFDRSGALDEEIRKGVAGCDNDKYIHVGDAMKIVAEHEVHDFGLRVKPADESEAREIEDECAEWAEANRGGFEFPPSVRPSFEEDVGAEANVFRQR